MKIRTSDLNGGNGGYYIAEIEEPDNPGNDIWGQEWYPDIDKWCAETFGAQDFWGIEPVTGWKRMRNKYFFDHQDKLSWFVIRWS